MRSIFVLFGSVSVLALAVALYALHRSGADAELAQQIGRDVTHLRSALAVDHRELSQRLGALMDSVEALRAGPNERAVAASAAERSPESALTDRLEELVTRYEEMTSRLEELESRSPPTLVIGSPESRETEEERVRIVEENQTVAADRSLAAFERLGALRNLRFRDGRSHEVTLAMIELIEDPNVDDGMRADIIRNLDGVEFEELKPPLLKVLANSSSSEVRSETVETLQAFYDDPGVWQAVAHVRDNDPDFRVRMEATQRLQSHPRPGER